MTTNEHQFVYTPEQIEYIKERIADPYWRIASGMLYKIIIKGDDDEDDLVIPFKPNRAQRRFLKSMWNRNLILKARQLGFTTLITIVWLDHAQYNANSRCGIIAQDKQAAEVIFRDKVKFAYDNQPEFLKRMFPLKTENTKEIVFAHNNSSIRVATSVRSGTIHRLHVSEFGKICKFSPIKAREVVTGSIPAVPKNGVLVIESTAEGSEGYFHDMTQEALKLADAGKELNIKDYRIHFYAWWQAPDYRMPPEGINITAKEHEYFDVIEAKMKTKIDLEQRAWYIATLMTDFSGNQEIMWQEYPSTPQEAFQVSTDGNYYAQQMALVRKRGGILKIPKLDLPVYTFWDIGNSDGCAIWFMQQVGMEYRFIDYVEAHGEMLPYYYKALQQKNYIWGKHFLPHDAGHERLSDDNKSTEQMLNDLGLSNTVVLDRIDNIQNGIQITRSVFAECWFDETDCKLGISRLDNYKKSWNERQGRWSDTPLHDINAEGADAFRQFAQAKDAGLIKLPNKANKPKPRRNLSPRTL